MANTEATEEKTKEKSVTELLDEVEDEAKDILPEAEAKKLLTDSDLTLPSSYELDIIAEELLGALGTYKRASFGRRAARNTGDHKRATEMSALERYSRLVAALIMAEYPKAKTLAVEMGRVRAQRAKDERVRALADMEDEG